MIALDTGVLIELERGNRKTLESLGEFKEKHPAPSLPFPVFSEYYYGYLKKGKKKASTALQRLELFDILHSTNESAALFSEIKRDLERSGSIIPDMDILIASLVLSHGAILLTYDRQFAAVESLKARILDH